ELQPADPHGDGGLAREREVDRGDEAGPVGRGREHARADREPGDELRGAGAGCGAGGGGSLRPSVPRAGRTSAPAAIVHANGPLPRPADRQVQSTSFETPLRRATTRPAASATVTVQRRGPER